MNINDYYQNIEALFEVVKVLGGRETVFRGLRESKLGEDKPVTFRCIKAHNLYFLKWNFRAFYFLKHPLNIYYSLAHLQNMPIFSFDLKKRKVEQNNFIENFDKYMTGFDYAIDFDVHNKEDYDKSLSDFKRMTQMMDEYKIPYTAKCSGSGFHINR